MGDLVERKQSRNREQHDDAGSRSAPAPTGRSAKQDTTGTDLDAVIEFWQSRTARPLTREDGRQIRENLTGFFRVLAEWEAAEGGTTQSLRGSEKLAA